MEAEIFGYVFSDPSLLDEALTAPSYRMEHPKARDNQRLEFLGDAVLGLLAADRLYHGRPCGSEGDLTVSRTRMVSAAALCKAAAAHGLSSRLRMNAKAGVPPENSKTYADAVEAVIGAAWLDGGLEAARTVFDALDLENVRAPENPKGELQIKAQSMKPPRRPEYGLVSVAGKAHEPVFTVKVSLEGVGEAVASARNRKEAEFAAAAELLSRCFTVNERDDDD